MKIDIGVDRRRSRLGRLIFTDDSGRRHGPFDACASADPSTARSQGNPAADPRRPGGPVAFGGYRFQHLHSVPKEHRADMGTHTLAFEPVTGEAREGESFGRLVLLLHGGDTGFGGRLRASGAGLRVGADALEAIVTAVKSARGVELEVHEAPLGFWDYLLFWRRRPAFDPDPDAQRSRRDDDDDDRNSTSTSSSSSSASDSFRGGGGSFGGAGASGSWDAPSAGRAAAGVAAAGAAGVAASELGLTGSDRDAPGEGGGGFSGSASGVATSHDSSSDGSSASDSGSTSDSASSSASTSY